MTNLQEGRLNQQFQHFAKIVSDGFGCLNLPKLKVKQNILKLMQATQQNGKQSKKEQSALAFPHSDTTNHYNQINVSFHKKYPFYLISIEQNVL